MRNINLFVEDEAHEVFLIALIQLNVWTNSSTLWIFSVWRKTIDQFKGFLIRFNAGLELGNR